MLEASCHCGAIRFEVAERPQWLNSCNCSLCRRIGALWAYDHPSQVRMSAGVGKTVAYVQGDRTLGLHHCPTCGCVTHWESVNKETAERMGLNARLLDPAEIEGVRVRRFDGASTWTYLD
ncbi:MAG TPA: GFA family protein [Azospirillaceae bacterium]|nr:GFA family protein [Azospirillaceae bacterium]